MYESVLVATDGSLTADLAADHALALAAAFDAHVTALGVVDVEGTARPFDAERAVEAVAERAEAVAVDTLVVEGDPGEEIVDRAAAHDLVVLGTHGRSVVGRLLVGSTSARVVRESPVPVVTVGGDGSRTDGDAGTDDAHVSVGADADDWTAVDYDDVLVPTDGSDAAEAAVEHGLAVADAVDATVHTVYVVDVNALVGGADTTLGGTGPGTGDDASGDLLEPLFESGEAATARVAARARAAGLAVETEVIEGSPGSSLVDYVEETAVDFVAMGTHGHTGLDRVLLGSTTERVMRNVSVPVLSVRADGAA